MARLGTPPNTVIKSDKLQDARALAMVQSRIHGRSLKQIAEEFGVSTDTVERSLSRAEKMNLTERYEDYLVGRLAPLAIGAIQNALENNDAAVAMKILESIGLIKKPKDMSKSQGDGEADTWEVYLKARKPRRTDGNEAGAEAHTGESGPDPRDGAVEARFTEVDGPPAGQTRQADE